MPLFLAPTEPLAPILWEWLGQNGRGAGVSLLRAEVPLPELQRVPTTSGWLLTLILTSVDS